MTSAAVNTADSFFLMYHVLLLNAQNKQRRIFLAGVACMFV